MEERERESKEMCIECLICTRPCAYLLEVLFNIENKSMSGCHYYSQFKGKGGSKAQEGEATFA